MLRSKSWVGLYALVLAFIGIFASLQIGAMVSPGKKPALNPLIGLMEIISGRVQGTFLTWVLLALTGIGCLVFYLMVGEEVSDKDPRRKNDLLKAHKLEATARKTNLSAVASLNGLSCGKLIGSTARVTQNWESVGMYWMGPRMGKTSGFIVRHALEAPGAYLFTSNKLDGVAEIIVARQNLGTVHIFDPEGLLPLAKESATPLMCWDFVDSITSRSRAEAYAKILNDSSKLTGNGEVASSDSFFEPLAEKLVIAALLMAKKQGLTVVQMLDILSESNLNKITADLGESHHLLGNEIRKIADQPDKTKENILAGASRILTALSNDEVIPWISPDEGNKVTCFDPYKFVQSQDTLIILVKDGGSSAATLSSLLVEAVMNAGVDLASPRLDPPLVCDLDEANNTVHIRTLPNRYTYFGSKGIITNCYLQTFSSGVRLWGEKGFQAIRSASTIKVVGGGIQENELKSLSEMLGTYEKRTTSISTSHLGGLGSTGNKTSSTSRRKEEVLSVSELAQLPQFRAVVTVAGIGSGLVDAVPWFKDKDLKDRISTEGVEKVAKSLGYSLSRDTQKSKNKTEVKTLV